MKQYFTYFMIYSFLGFLLERIINLIAFGYYYDNSVLYGPYQPLYGLGLILAILFYDFVLHDTNKYIKIPSLILIAIITTAFSEFINGEAYELLYGSELWDYGMTFTCSYPYVCGIPTSLFGLLSALVILLLHPFIKSYVSLLKTKQLNIVFYVLLVILIIDSIFTYIV
jgi:uncharacterized membrane protein